MTKSRTAGVPSLPDDWGATNVGAVATIENGCPFESSHFNDKEGLPLIRIRDVHSGCSKTLYSGPYEDRFLVKDGDLLVGMDGEFRVRKWRAGTGLLNQRVCRLVPEETRVDRDFLCFSIAHPLKQIEDFTSYTTVKHISAGQIRAIIIPFPGIAEQRKIAGVLSLVQRAIEQQERAMALTTELKKSLMHKLFTEGLHGEQRKETEMGPAPESWVVAELSGLLEIKHGFAFEGEFFASDGHYILLTPGHFFEDGGFRDQKDKTKFYTGEFPRGYLLAKGDLLVVMTEQKAGLLGSSIMIPESDRYVHNQRLGLIHKLDETRLDKLFLYYYFNTAEVRKCIAMNSSGSKVRHTSPGKIREMKIALPSLDEQRQIVAILQAADARAGLLCRKHSALADLFRTLLHRLMTGQLRTEDLVLPESNVRTQAHLEAARAPRPAMPRSSPASKPSSPRRSR
jgi:type I restriction enzyme S subunit